MLSLNGIVLVVIAGMHDPAASVLGEALREAMETHMFGWGSRRGHSDVATSFRISTMYTAVRHCAVFVQE